MRALQYRGFLDDLGIELRRPTAEDPNEVKAYPWVIVIDRKVFGRDKVNQVDPWLKGLVQSELQKRHAVNCLRKIYDEASVIERGIICGYFLWGQRDTPLGEQLHGLSDDALSQVKLPYHWRKRAREIVPLALSRPFRTVQMELRDQWWGWEVLGAKMVRKKPTRSKAKRSSLSGRLARTHQKTSQIQMEYP